jgi:hypothetical protein
MHTLQQYPGNHHILAYLQGSGQPAKSSS